MVRESVNPDMDLKGGSVPNPTAPKETKKAGGRDKINPDMDLAKEGPAQEANTGGAINIKRRPTVNPDMDLTREGATGEAIIEEKSSAVHPGVGTKPTGKKAAKKSTQPE